MDDAARRGEDVSGLDISTEPVKQTVTVPEAKDPRQREWGFKNTVFGRTKKDLHTHTHIYIYTLYLVYMHRISSNLITHIYIYIFVRKGGGGGGVLHGIVVFFPEMIRF